MKLEVLCPQCIKENLPLRPYQVEVTDHGFYEFTCDRGHDALMLLHVPRHELLFDSGAAALLDGYPREAVASFAAAVERFYEYIVRVFARSRNIDPLQLAKTWKSVQKQSERQLGAFRFLYLMEFGTAAPDMEAALPFRNRVIHQGHFPSHADALDYGEKCLLHMTDILLKLSEAHLVAVQHLADESAEKLRDAAPKKVPLHQVPGSIVMHTRQSRNAGHDAPLADWLKRLRELRESYDRWRAIAAKRGGAWPMIRQ